ncbi:hypothetical protein [Calothrix sp. 336/3]|uniref:hypothetical protein n=1 Tax=Calothrix sp. 336/3 TaxID=1337936 RepID=UPI0004E2E545|nr:hypothetical protein [Calothrix sp. 336/3]AKG22125.1 hypothetical protein IJ00_13415 [Calothrix sp. 336/3]
MKPRILERHKYTFPTRFHNLNLLLCVTSVSCLCLLAESHFSLVTANPPPNLQLGLGNLPVPASPTPGVRTQPRGNVPPPPGEVTPGMAVAPILNPLSKTTQQSPGDAIKELENSLIQQQSRNPKGNRQKKPVAQNTLRFVPVKLPTVTAAEDTSDTGLRLLGVTNTPSNLETTNSPVTPTFNQYLYSQGKPVQVLPNTTPTQEFTAPSSMAPLPPLPGTTTQSEFSSNSTPTFNQFLSSQNSPTFSQPVVPNTSNYRTVPTSVPSSTAIKQPGVVQQRPVINSTALKEPSLRVQGVYVTQGEDTSARARLAGIYPLTPQLLLGATLDLTSEGTSFDDSRREGLNINELYLATSVGGLPNLRFAVGQLDLTSYFDRNSFAKDGASQFFNPVFQTNPALAVAGISSRTGFLLNWSVNDNIEAKGAVFSSSDKLSDFSLDGFAGEIGVRFGNAIIRGTYATNRDAGIRDSFAESFGIARNAERTVFGTQKDDREEAYGVNAEVFIPNLKLGLFGRYGRYENRDLGEGADTYVVGASFLDLFTADDKLGLAYGRGLSNDRLRSQRKDDVPDVLEMFYDFPLVSNLRLGFTVQGRDSFEETVFGIRVKTEFDVTPRGRNR